MKGQKGSVFVIGMVIVLLFHYVLFHAHTIHPLKTALAGVREYRGLPPLSSKEFLKLTREKQELVAFEAKLANRSLNEGFSGGEKKRNEIFQLAMLDPKLSILDETDSGLDIDALRIVSDGVNKLRSNENAFIVITHYQRTHLSLETTSPDEDSVRRAVADTAMRHRAGRCARLCGGHRPGADTAGRTRTAGIRG